MEYFDNRTKENIEKLIRENGDINYDSLISDGGYYYFYHLSSLRHALLDWYPFIKGDVLEVGASYGAMTGLYLKKADSVDVLEKDPGRCESLRLRFKDKEVSIICSDLFDYDADKRYDYLFLIDDASVYLEDADRILAKAKSLLKEGGTAVIGFRNRNGIKYDCGAIDEYVTEQFNTKLLIDRDDFDAKAHRHFEYVTHYYPFPDHIYTQAVFSEMCPPKGNLRDRVIPLDPFYSPLIKR